MPTANADAILPALLRALTVEDKLSGRSSLSNSSNSPKKLDKTRAGRSQAKSIGKPKSPPSPIDRLPPHVLSKIFVLCLPGTTEKYDTRASSRYAPLLLTNICTSWRSLAVATPQLWTTFDFFLNMWGREPIGIVTVLFGIQTWLGWSGSLPLDIHFTCFAIPDHKNDVQLVCDALCRYASRWETMEMYTLTDLATWKKLDVPLLRNFCIRGPVNGLPFSSAPRLTTLTMMEFYRTPKDTPTIPWHQLTKLTISQGQTRAGLLRLIENCPRLESLTVWEVDDRSSTDRLPLSPRIEHHTLRHIEAVFSQDCRQTLDSLVLPALKKLELGYKLDYINSTSFPVGSCYREILGLLERSDCQLERITLINPKFNSEHMRKFLSDERIGTLKSISVISHDNDGIFDDELLNQLTYSEEPHTAPLCPEVTDFDLIRCISAKNSPGSFGKMIWSRTSAPDVENRLKAFEVITSKPLPKEDDELLKLAKEKGVKSSYGEGN